MLLPLHSVRLLANLRLPNRRQSARHRGRNRNPHPVQRVACRGALPHRLAEQERALRHTNDKRTAPTDNPAVLGSSD